MFCQFILEAFQYKGNITLFGGDAKKVAREESILSYIPEKPIYYEELTLGEHLQFIGSMYNTKSQIDGLIEGLELAGHLHKFPHELSKRLLPAKVSRNYIWPWPEKGKGIYNFNS